MGMHYANGVELSVLGPMALGAAGTTDIRMTGVAQMVAEVLRRIGAEGTGKRIAVLSILDHGGPHGCAMGEDQITLSTLPAHAAALARLRPHFAPGAIVHMRHQQLGRHPVLVRGLALLLGVPVYAGMGSSGPAQGGAAAWHDDYICARPDGRIVETAGRPETFDAGDFHVPAALLPRPMGSWAG